MTASQRAYIPGYGGWIDDPILLDVCVEYRDVQVVIRRENYDSTIAHISYQHWRLQQKAEQEARNHG